MGVNLNIQSALETKLQNGNLGVDLTFANSTYAPNLGTSYIRATLLPAKTTILALDTTYRHTGIFQIDIFVPTNTGMKQMYTLLDNVTSLYKNSLTLSINGNNVFIQGISRGKSQRQDAWFTSFIQLDYLYIGI